MHKKFQMQQNNTIKKGANAVSNGFFPHSHFQRRQCSKKQLFITTYLNLNKQLLKSILIISKRKLSKTDNASTSGNGTAFGIAGYYFLTL